MNKEITEIEDRISKLEDMMDLAWSEYHNLPKEEKDDKMAEHITIIKVIRAALDGAGRELEAKREDLEFPNVDTYPLGSFEVSSGTLIISDPCYDKGIWCAGTLDNVKNGSWEASTLIFPNYKTGGGGRRNAELSAELSNGEPVTDWKLSDIHVGVDSGQAGIFDGERYPEDPGDYSGDTWYRENCDITLDSKLKAGVHKDGVVSSSGYGDGGYECFYKEDSDGKIVAVKIVFIKEKDEVEDV